MNIQINLANRPYVDLHSLIRWLRWSIGALAILILGAGGAAYFVHERATEASSHHRATEERMSALREEQLAYRVKIHSVDVVEIANDTEELNLLFDAKAFSWTAVMKDLETVLPNGVQVTAIEPLRTTAGETILHVRAVGPHEKGVDLLQNLEQSKRFMKPKIVGESLANQSAGQKNSAVDRSTMMEFDILVNYGGDAEGSSLQPLSTNPPSTTSVKKPSPVSARALSAFVAHSGQSGKNGGAK